MKKLDEKLRYSRQQVLPEIGEAGQQKLKQAKLVIIGCGALGGMQAQLLARIGIGHLRLIDRDIVDVSNLPRQVLFSEDDVLSHRAKVEAAARQLSQANSSLTIEPILADVTPRNIDELTLGFDLILDATDNFETRYLINDIAIKHQQPWIYGGVLGTAGLSMMINPGSGPCLRCLFENPPAAGDMPTCETAGVINTIVAMIATLQVSMAVRFIVAGHTKDGGDTASLHSVDIWNLSMRSLQVTKKSNCLACGQHRWEFLSGEKFSWSRSLCGKNAVQIDPHFPGAPDLNALAGKLSFLGQSKFSGLLLDFQPADQPDFELVIFPDGRVMILGTTDESLARSLYAKYLGH